MYAYLKGTIAYTTPTGAVIDVGGVGYEVGMTETDILKCNASVGKVMTIYTYLSVREDGMSLYGFSTKAEKNMFLHLISVNGVGPKLALTILGGTDINSLMSAIMSGNTFLLNGIKGVGKKTAERIIVDLRDSISKIYTGPVTPLADSSELTQIQSDAVAALVALGFKEQDALSKVQKAYKPDMNITQLINKAMRS